MNFIREVLTLFVLNPDNAKVLSWGGAKQAFRLLFLLDLNKSYAKMTNVMVGKWSALID